MPFQTQTNMHTAPLKEGARASNNPFSTVVAGNSALISDGTVRVGGFAWNSAAGVASGSCLTALVPAGFVADESQAQINSILSETSMLIAAGTPVTEYDRGDFAARSVFTEAAIDQKVYANLLSGKIMCAATGTFPVTPAGVSGTITASCATTGVLTVTATSVYLAKGMLISDSTHASYPVGTYINSQVSGSAGSTGTYQLTTLPSIAIASSATVKATTQDVGGATVSSGSASQGSATLTINTKTDGSVYPGQRVSATNVPAGTYVSALGTYTDLAGNGTITLSAVTTDTISAAAILFSPWIETPWYVKSNGNVGDLIKIGVKN